MSDIDSRIADIQSRIDAARTAKARAAFVKETAQETSDKVMQQLKAGFGVDNLTDARARLTELQTELQQKLDAITEALDRIEL